MTQYRNRSGNSGISEYEIKDDKILIRFGKGKIYTYRISTIGQNHYDEMVQYAKEGKGLNTHINKHPIVKKGADEALDKKNVLHISMW